MLSDQTPIQPGSSDAIQPEKDVLGTVDTQLKRLTKNWTTFKTARQEWDFKLTAQSLKAISEILAQITAEWTTTQTSLSHAIQIDQEFVQSADYPPAIEAALKQVGIPLRGHFPTYEFPPFKLTFSPAHQSVKLTMGRRSQQTHIAAIEPLTQWVWDHYKQVVQSKFDPDRFCKELLGAYELLNPLTLNTRTVQWGHPILLKDIYKLLTLKQAVRKDYPESLFTFDLARLKEQVDITYGDYQFELVPSRQQTSGFLLVNSRGQESRVSSLVIYTQALNLRSESE